MLQAKDLAVIRGDQVVFAGLSFQISAGEAVLLTGRNGAGKSTLLRLLAGLLRPAQGLLSWQGGDAAVLDVLADLPAHAARLRYLAHAEALKPGLTAAENLRFWQSRWGGDIGQALEALDLLPLADLPARMLSAGQKRRLALARLALAPVPLWLLDEPSVGLDAASLQRLGQLMARHRAQGGAIIAATHLPLPLPDSRSLRLGTPA